MGETLKGLVMETEKGLSKTTSVAESPLTVKGA